MSERRGRGPTSDLDTERDHADVELPTQGSPGKRTLTAKLSGPRADASDPRAARSEAGASADPHARTEGAHELEGAHHARAEGAPKLDGEQHARSGGESNLDGESQARAAGRDEAELEPRTDPLEQAQPAPALEDDPDELREAEAWLEEVQSVLHTGMAEIHLCHAGCVHGQFDRMMTAQASDQELGVDVGALEAAYKQWKQGQRKSKGGAQPAPEATEAEPAPAPAPPGDAGAFGTQVGYAGTVSDAKPAGFPGLMGLATWNYANFTYPDLKLKTEQKDFVDHGEGSPSTPGEAKKAWFTEVQTTTSADAATSAIATPAGTYAIAGTEVVRDDDNKPVRFKKQVVVGGAAAGQIRAAEQEHLDDVSHAYTITLKAAEEAVNDAVGREFSDKSKATSIKMAKDAVKDALDPKLTENPRTWRAMLRRCAELTKSGRDASRWHTFQYFADLNTDADFAAKMISFHVQPNPNVGTTASADLIKL